MKVYMLEINKFKFVFNFVNGLMVFKVDVLVMLKELFEGIEFSLIMMMIEVNVCVLMQLLKV